jgi:diadenosine tetraphosphatase ApaH/serine/threonine PP2A family protein phosphatase
MLFVHANPFAPAQWGYVLGHFEAERSLHATSCGYVVCGHVHEPRLFHLSTTGRVADFVPTAGVELPVPPHRRWLVLPGSVGQPRDGNPAACYATLDSPAHTLTFHRVPYDHDGAAAKIRAAGLPQVLAERLRHGQ